MLFERKAAGLGAMHREGQGLGETICAAYESHESGFDGSLVLRMRWTLVPPPSACNGARILCQAKYTFLPGGGVHVDSSFFAPSTLPPLPRAGVRFAVPSRFDQAQWLGLGPHESYDDRRFSPHLGTFSSSVQDLHTPYVYPQVRHPSNTYHITTHISYVCFTSFCPSFPL